MGNRSWLIAATISVAGWMVPGLAAAQSLSAARSQWALSVGGLTAHFKEPECQGCSYKSAVPGIGLQRHFVPLPESSVRYTLSGGFQSDSFGGSGGYAAAIASLVKQGNSFSFSAGLGAFGIYRYMDYGAGSEDAKRVFVPAILPVFSIENTRAGIGGNVIIAPNFSYRGRDRSGFVLFQLSYRFN